MGNTTGYRYPDPWEYIKYRLHFVLKYKYFPLAHLYYRFRDWHSPSRMVYLPIGMLKFSHPVSLSEPKDFRVRDRVNTMRGIVGIRFSQRRLQQLMPSTGPIRVRGTRNGLTVIDGNGRVAALRATQSPATKVEVKYYG